MTAIQLYCYVVDAVCGVAANCICKVAMYGCAYTYNAVSFLSDGMINDALI